MKKTSLAGPASSRASTPHSVSPPRRLHPRNGRLLTLTAIEGSWHPSGAVAGAGIFAVIWPTARGLCWAALHDFEPAIQLTLVNACRANDQEAQWARMGGHS